MAASTIAILCTTSLFLAAAHGQIPNINYYARNNVPHSKGGRLFDIRYGVAKAEQLMPAATGTVWKILEITNFPVNTNNYTDVFFTVDEGLGYNVAGETTDNKIVINADVIPFWTSTEMPLWMDSLVYHEMTHVWQTYFNGPQRIWSTNATGIIEGTAEYVTIKAGKLSPECVGWQPEPDDTWFEGYCPTAYFLEYLTTLKRNIVPELNRRINRNGYREADFVTLLGRGPDELWNDFLANRTTLQPGVSGDQVTAGWDVPSITYLR